MAGNGENGDMGEASGSNQHGGSASETTQERRRIVRSVFLHLIG